METTTLRTADGVSIAAHYYHVQNGDRFALLLHMMPSTKEAWKRFAEALAEKGISSLAIDFRGHGESTGGPAGYREQTDAEHQAKEHDVRAGWEELMNRGATPEKSVVIGASIGANLAIRFLENEPRMPAAVALSPGMDYHGVTTNDVITRLAPNQRVLIAASREDVASYEGVKALNVLNSEQTYVVEREGADHGTDLIENDAKVFDLVVAWVSGFGI